MVILTLPYPPSVNAMYATFKGRRIISKEGREYKKTVAQLAAINKAPHLEGELILTVNIFRPQKSGDLDNRLKALQDALSGVCYRDDKQIVEIHAYRYDDKTNPRAEVVIVAKDARNADAINFFEEGGIAL